jgi:hypothetical protein
MLALIKYPAWSKVARIDKDCTDTTLLRWVDMEGGCCQAPKVGRVFSGSCKMWRPDVSSYWGLARQTQSISTGCKQTKSVGVPVRQRHPGGNYLRVGSTLHTGGVIAASVCSICVSLDGRRQAACVYSVCKHSSGVGVSASQVKATGVLCIRSFCFVPLVDGEMKWVLVRFLTAAKRPFFLACALA